MALKCRHHYERGYPMNDKDRRLLQLFKKTPHENILANCKAAMTKASDARFKKRVRAIEDHRRRVDPLRTAMREAMTQMPQFAKALEAMKALKPASLHKTTTAAPRTSAPKEAQLRRGSVHLVDFPPFQALSWQQETGSGPPYTDPPPTADGSTGNMSFLVQAGGNANNVVSCWAAIGQSDFVPTSDPELDFFLELGFPGVLRFTASPSFSWDAAWGSDWWRQAAGNLWIGQVVNRFDLNGSLIDTPVSYQTNLFSWNDSSWADAPPDQSGESTGWTLQCDVLVEPAFFYNCWVWIGATANGDGIDSGWSMSNCQMNANVSSLVLDTFP
jgi:hypothetical protein